MTWEEAKREMMFAKRNVLEGSYIDQAYDKAIEALSQPEQKWILYSEHTPDEGRECWITAKTTEEVYRGIFTEFYGIRHDVGFICDDGFMWWNTAKAWMYFEKPEPYKGENECL